MFIRKRSYLILTAAALIITVQIACSVGGFTLSKNDSTSQKTTQPQAQSSGAEQPGPTQSIQSTQSTKSEKSQPTKFVILNTPTPETAIQVEPPQSGKANAAGRILWNNQPVVGNEVMLCENMEIFKGCQGAQFTTNTSEKGYYVFASVPPGQYAIVMKAVDAESWIYITGGLSISAKKHELKAGETLMLKDQHIYRLDLKQTSPAIDEKVNQEKPTLVWETYPDAAYYEVWLNPRSGQYISDKVTENKFTVPRALLNCDYTWSIEAFNKYGIEIAEHDGYMHFQVTGQPASCEVLLNAPLDGANLKGTGNEFAWQAHPLADHYLLYVQDKKFKNIVDSVRVNGTSYTVTDTLPPGDYQWYIAAYDHDTWIAASDHYKFKVSAP
jgi:hypothetical protein